MPPQEQPPFAIPGNRIDDIFELITKLARGGKEGSYRVYPPQQVIDDPAVTERDDAVERLRDTTWNVRFYDGHVERFTFVEFVTFLHLIIDLRNSMRRAEVDARLKGSTPAAPAIVDRKLHIPSVMSPASVKRLLKGHTFQAKSTPD
jgi:hypothetical protein